MEKIIVGYMYEKWSGKYLKIAKCWKENWANFSTCFKYPEAVRRLRPL